MSSPDSVVEQLVARLRALGFGAPPPDASVRLEHLAQEVLDQLGGGEVTDETLAAMITDGLTRSVLNDTYATIGEVLPVDVEESAGGYIRGTRDNAGRIAEDAIDEEGKVPDWILERWKNRMGISDGGAPRIHIVVCGGQSNASISGGATPPAGLYDTDPRLWKWHRATSNIIPMSTSEAYLLPAFAREYIATVPSNVHVLIVPAGAGETGFTTTSLSTPPAGYRTVPNGTWDRTLTSDPNNLYARMVADVTAARSAANLISTGTPKVAALLWSQGEGDVGHLTGPQYQAKLDDLIATFRADISQPSLPVLIGSMTPEYVARTPAANDIQNVLGDTPRRVQKTAFVWGPAGSPRTDQPNYIHWSVPGQVERGRMFCDALPRAHWNYTGVYATPPQNLSAVRSGTVLSVTWEPSPTRATAYTVEYSTDGTTWSPVTIPGSAIGLAGTATVPATGAISVRASATNETNTSPHVTIQL